MLLSKRASLIFLAILVTASVTPAVASQRYLGAYFDGSVKTTDEVIFMTQFLDTDITDIPALGSFISVLSVAGGNGTTVKDVMYQNVFGLFRDDDLEFAPQTWEKENREDIDRVVIGDSSTYAMYGRTIFNTATNKIEYYAYVYDTIDDFGDDTPTVYHYTQNRADGGVDNFLVGDENLGGDIMRYCQVGIESKYPVFSTSDLENRQHDFGYLDGSTWKYMAARSTHGDDARICKDANYVYAVGGSKFYSADVASSSTDMVEWELTTTTCDDDISIWLWSGNVVKEALYPFNYP